MNQTQTQSLSPARFLDRLSVWVNQAPVISWFLRRGYAQGAFWAVMIGVVSNTNDVLMCKLGNQFHTVEITFFRYLFSMLTILPFMLPYGTRFFKTKQLNMHWLRAIVGVVAVGLWCYSVQVMPLAANTAIGFTMHLFVLLMAYLILKEKVDAPRWIAALVGFLGLMIIVQPGTDAFRIEAMIPIAAAMSFALLCIMAKKMITDEHSYTLLFYFGLGTTALAAIPLPFFWTTPGLVDLLYLAALGIGANLIQVCLFRAYASADASSLAPYMYVEMIISALSGYFFFKQIPSTFLYIGAILIATSTFYITIVETKRKGHAG